MKPGQYFLVFHTKTVHICLMQCYRSKVKTYTFKQFKLFKGSSPKRGFILTIDHNMYSLQLCLHCFCTLIRDHSGQGSTIFSTHIFNAYLGVHIQCRCVCMCICYVLLVQFSFTFVKMSEMLYVNTK